MTGDRVVLSKLSVCEDTVKELSAGGEVERKVIFCARLEALVKFDMGWVRMTWVGTERERQTMLGWSRPVRRSISVQTLASFPFIFFLDDLEGDVVDGRARGCASRETRGASVEVHSGSRGGL